ncbi:hypothetical protein SAMN02745196_01202 [Clostridium collagenovorans DSM 3089]|uniref:Uncharacterized protein n=1 Tax=Clostridium collagenovorans DSM 3089 TaxID=1121306 RepID=A0A1M5VAW8_9CLOT|nr:hypothetical protein [Clostridium collagenovorans]SHH72351.1 hypothetical protein SAMN02745196_01202 [Clostridium collagenovorans DSM 3089]
MKDKEKFLLIYVILIIPTLIIGMATQKPFISVNNFAWIIVLFNTVVFLVSLRLFKVESQSALFFLTYILVIFIILIIDKDYFYAAYIQSTPTCIFPKVVLNICIILAVPFIPIFEVLFNLNIFSLSAIIIPAFIGILMTLSKVVIEFNRKGKK